MKKTKRQLEREEQVYNISTLAAGNFSLQEVLGRLVEAAAKVTGASACAIRLLNEDTGDLRMRSTYNLSDKYRNKGDVTRDDQVIREAFSGKAVVIDDSRDDSRIRYRDAAMEEKLISQLTVPMMFRDEPIGVLRVYSPQPRAFSEDDISLARLVATQCAVAITNAKLYAKAIEGARMAEQMHLAAVIQRRMIPAKAPMIEGLDIAAVYQPCFQVGGDLYDFIEVGKDRLVIAIADVIGKGIPAAMMMSMFRGTLRAYADGGFIRHSLLEIVTELNRVALRECRNGEFITLFIASINIKNMEMTYCSCGHEPGLLLRQGKSRDLDAGGLVLGVTPEAVYNTEIIDLKNGDTVLLYTDGLIDTVNFENEFWGREKLMETFEKYKAERAGDIVDHILGHRRRFAGLANQIDDTSLVVVKVNKDG